jgi:cytochrome c556
MSLRTLLSVAALTLAAVPALAQEPAPTLSNVEALRKHAMGMNGAAAGLGAAMLKGEAPFDARVAQSVFVIMHASASGFGLMFPEAAPPAATGAKETVWTDRAGFEAAVNKFIADTNAAVAAKVADQAAFAAQFGAVTANCKSCHESYKKPQQ